MKTIPTDRLNDAYVAAMRDRTMAGLITPMEIIAAYRRTAEDRRLQHSSTSERMKYLDGPRPCSPAEIRQIVSGVRTGAITAGRFNAAGDHALKLVRTVEGDAPGAVESIDKEAKTDV